VSRLRGRALPIQKRLVVVREESGELLAERGGTSETGARPFAFHTHGLYGSRARSEGCGGGTWSLSQLFGEEEVTLFSLRKTYTRFHKELGRLDTTSRPASSSCPPTFVNVSITKGYTQLNHRVQPWSVPRIPYVPRFHNTPPFPRCLSTPARYYYTDRAFRK